MNDNEVSRILDFMDAFIKDDIIAKVKMFHRGGWSFSSQNIYYESKNKDILNNSIKITCVEFEHSAPDKTKTKVDISLKITNPDLLSDLLNKKIASNEMANIIKITLKRIDEANAQEKAYTYNRESFFDNVGKFILYN
jgi:glutathionyl-hydroquinone reductase